MLVDILIATPGRLAEHILHTPGFTLQHLQFLVLDEADRLLAQSFQNWTEVVTRELATPKTLDGTLNLENCIRGHEPLPLVGQRYVDTLFHTTPSGRRVRKLIFSATLSYDVGKLSTLQIHNPENISIQTRPQSPQRQTDDAVFSLPETLTEYVLAVKENKPLLLIALLDRYKLHQKSLVFCHSTETATRLHHLLERVFGRVGRDVSAAVVSSEVPLRTRKKLLASFVAGRLNMYTPSSSFLTAV
jgi:ATP-dependent RNA helicase DDX51/DBP6